MMDLKKKKALLRGLFVFSLFISIFARCSKQDSSAGAGPKNTEYFAALESAAGQGRAYGGETIELAVRAKNKGKAEWTSSGRNPCLLSYHLLDEMGKVLKFDNPRTPLSRTVRPGESVEIPVHLKIPLEPGRYVLEFDFVREGLAWFKDSGSKTLNISLLVEERSWPEDEYPLDLAYGKFTKFRASDARFDKLGKLIRLTLSHDEVEFPGKTGTVRGFAAGSGYPQIWLRDAATIIPASRYYYPEDRLTSWLEEYLALQKADGSLEDWVDGQGRSDKNTTETDQEASAVQAAYQIFLLRGPEWLKKEVFGEAVVDRLEKSLLFVFSERFSEEYGLITGAHTADWGDVDIEDAGQQAIYVDEKTHWTADIYDQAMCFQACRELSLMFVSLGEPDKAVSWQKRAALLRKQTDRRLWQEDKGFYRVHLHLDSLTHSFEENEMFAMGGNAQAILSGLADAAKAIRIIGRALQRQRQFNISTISGSLLPPYPAGLFKHPALDEPYEYQNGGQWDWFGGRLLYAMFENGFSLKAKGKLLEIAEKNMANSGLFEWDTREGSGRGSDYYGGSAGSLARALWEGYFGVRIEEKGLRLEPRLGEDEAMIHLYLPAADLYVAYDYRPDRAQKKILFHYASNFPHPGEIKILMPWTFFSFKDKSEAKKKLTVLRDGQKIPFQWESLNEDDFIVFETDFKDHTVELRSS